MTGHHSYGVGHGFLAALGVHAVALQHFGFQRLEQGQVEGAQHPERFERARRIHSAVSLVRGPRILVIGLDGSAAGADLAAQAPADHDFRLGQVGDDFADGPLGRRGRFAQLRGSEPAHQPRELARRGSLYCQRVLALGQTQHEFLRGLAGVTERGLRSDGQPDGCSLGS